MSILFNNSPILAALFKNRQESLQEPGSFPDKLLSARDLLPMTQPSVSDLESTGIDTPIVRIGRPETLLPPSDNPVDLPVTQLFTRPGHFDIRDGVHSDIDAFEAIPDGMESSFSIAHSATRTIADLLAPKEAEELELDFPEIHPGPYLGTGLLTGGTVGNLTDASAGPSSVTRPDTLPDADNDGPITMQGPFLQDPIDIGSLPEEPIQLDLQRADRPEFDLIQDYERPEPTLLTLGVLDDNIVRVDLIGSGPADTGDGILG